MTCTGSSISADGTLLAIGDFTGEIKVFCSKTHKLLQQAHLLVDQIRYLHFHDSHNNVLLIGTFSGNVYSWSNVGVDLESQPEKLVTLNKTVTNIRTTQGRVKLNQLTTVKVHYVIFGTTKG